MEIAMSRIEHLDGDGISGHQYVADEGLTSSLASDTLRYNFTLYTWSGILKLMNLLLKPVGNNLNERSPVIPDG